MCNVRRATCHVRGSKPLAGLGTSPHRKNFCRVLCSRSPVVMIYVVRLNSMQYHLFLTPAFEPIIAFEHCISCKIEIASQY
jgi:hypothetical protein